MKKSRGFKKLQEGSYEKEDESIDDYELCKSCYIVDERIGTIWGNMMTLFLYKYPDRGQFCIKIFLMNCYYL